MEKLVKGATAKGVIIGIRGDKVNKDIYDKILSDKAKNLLNQRILDSAWYPFDAYKELFNVMIKVAGKNNPILIKKWGRLYGKQAIEQLYKGLVRKRSHLDAIGMYDRLYKLWFNFGTQSTKIISDNEFHIIFENFEKDFEAWFILASGWMEAFFETFLEEKITALIIEKTWEGASKTIIKITLD